METIANLIEKLKRVDAANAACIANLEHELAAIRKENAELVAQVVDPFDVPAGATLFVNDGEPRKVERGDNYSWADDDGNVRIAYAAFDMPKGFVRQVVVRVDGPADIPAPADWEAEFDKRFKVKIDVGYELSAHASPESIKNFIRKYVVGPAAMPEGSFNEQQLRSAAAAALDYFVNPVSPRSCVPERIKMDLRMALGLPAVDSDEPKAAALPEGDGERPTCAHQVAMAEMRKKHTEYVTVAVQTVNALQKESTALRAEAERLREACMEAVRELEQYDHPEFRINAAKRLLLNTIAPADNLERAPTAVADGERIVTRSSAAMGEGAARTESPLSKSLREQTEKDQSDFQKAMGVPAEAGGETAAEVTKEKTNGID